MSSLVSLKGLSALVPLVYLLLSLFFSLLMSADLAVSLPLALALVCSLDSGSVRFAARLL